MNEHKRRPLFFVTGTFKIVAKLMSVLAVQRFIHSAVVQKRRESARLQATQTKPNSFEQFRSPCKQANRRCIVGQTRCGLSTESVDPEKRGRNNLVEADICTVVAEKIVPNIFQGMSYA